MIAFSEWPLWRKWQWAKSNMESCAQELYTYNSNKWCYHKGIAETISVIPSSEERINPHEN
eukprot:2233763-Amphidinium_carterae.1